MQSLKKVLTGHEDNENAPILNVSAGILTNDSVCPSLSWETRIKGFIVCAISSFALSIIGTITLGTGNYLAFALFYTFGTLVGIGSTMFLKGPVAQMKGMFKESRIIATVVLLVMMSLTITSAVAWKNPLLAVLFCMLQYVAYIWYCLSYIPYARDAVKSCLSSCF